VLPDALISAILNFFVCMCFGCLKVDSEMLNFKGYCRE